MPLVYTGFTLLVFWYLWTPIQDAARTWKYDAKQEYWGDLMFQLDTLRQGHLALWNPYDRGGFPLHGDPQPGLLYPPNWILWLLGALLGAMHYALTEAKILAHWVLGAVGMHLFLRRRGAAEPACYIGGTLFAFASPAIRYGASALNWSFAWIPWVLLASDFFADRPGLRRAALLGTSVAMVLLSGGPAMVLYLLIIAIPYGVYVLRGRLRASLVPIAAAAGVALLWVLPLIASNLEQLPQSVRDTRDLGFITRSSFHPTHVLNVIVPRLDGENIYYGLLPLACFAILVAARPLGRATVFLLVAGAGGLLALGEHADFLSGAASSVPLFTLFRWAHRYLYVTTAAVAAGAGLGLGYVLSLDDPERKRALARQATWVCGLITLVLAVGWMVSIVVSKQITAARNDALGLAVIAAGAGTWILRALLLSEGRTRSAYAWAAAALFALDLWAANVPAVRPRLGPRPGAEMTRDHVAVALEGVGDLSYRVYDHDYLHHRPGVRLGIRDLSGYEGDPLALSRYAAFLDMVRRTPRALGHANVRYYLVGKPRNRLRITGAGTAKKVELDGKVQKGVFELAHVAPAVMYVPRPEQAGDQRRAMAALARMEPGTGAVVEGALPRPGPADAPVTAGRLVRLEPNRVVAEIETPGPGLVVIAEAFYPAWTATVDGAPAPILPANGMFRGVPVSAAGHHRIEMRFRPTRFWATLPAYPIALGLLLWVAAGAVRRRGRDDAAAPAA